MSHGEEVPDVEVDFDQIRPLAELAVLQDIATISFAAHAQQPVWQLDGKVVPLALRYRARDVHKAGGLLMVVVEHEVEVGWHDATQIVCAASGALHLVYQFPDDALTRFGDAVVSQFSAINGVYHAWPYIRESVQAHLGRLGLTGVVLPVWHPPARLPADGGFLEMVRPATSVDEE